ncbi:MAG: GspE/PulE family protein, partial [Candidatus Dojkabacteria bacterium]
MSTLPDPNEQEMQAMPDINGIVNSAATTGSALSAVPPQVAAVPPTTATPDPTQNQEQTLNLGHQQTDSNPQVGNGMPVIGSENLLAAALTRALIDQNQKQQIEAEVTQNGKSMEDALIAAGVDEKDVYKTKADMNEIEFVDLSEVEIADGILQKIPVNLARQNLAVPVSMSPLGLKVAMVDPLDIQKVQYMAAATGKKIIPIYSAPSLINYVLDNRYGASVGNEVAAALEDVGDMDTALGSTVGATTELGTGNLANAPVSKIVNMILEYAIKYKASDVHIEPREGKISVRFRVYGVLQEKLTLPKKLHPSVVSRVKILSNLKIDEHRIPQDGRFQVKLGETAVDLRVSVVPAVYGEKIVMRLLEKGGGQMSIEDTGMRGQALKVYKDALLRTQGIVLVTGPTGSGKTQTLASSLQILNKPEVNIMTLEDPVEIRVDGVNQVQVNGDVGLTFAKGLRSFLRQDPDIIMVGEIRDKETAELAVQAALTGHLVLATLHTNSAAGAIPRLIDMGVEPFLL